MKNILVLTLLFLFSSQELFTAQEGPEKGKLFDAATSSFLAIIGAGERVDDPIDPWSMSRMQQLVAGKADVDAKRWDGKYLLCVASQKNQLGFLRFLLRNGASVTVQNGMGQTALFSPHAGAVRSLLGAKADSFHKNGKGQTPLHCALVDGYSEGVVVALKDAIPEGDLSSSLRDYEGHNPLDHLARDEHCDAQWWYFSSRGAQAWKTRVALCGWLGLDDQAERAKKELSKKKPEEVVDAFDQLLQETQKARQQGWSQLSVEQFQQAFPGRVHFPYDVGRLVVGYVGRRMLKEFVLHDLEAGKSLTAEYPTLAALTVR